MEVVVRRSSDFPQTNNSATIYLFNIDSIKGTSLDILWDDKLKSDMILSFEEIAALDTVTIRKTTGEIQVRFHGQRVCVETDFLSCFLKAKHNLYM